MKCIVCVKQVPDTSGKVAVKEDGTMDRASMDTITNPDDLNAIEAALTLKDETGCEVVVVSMGPAPAEETSSETTDSDEGDWGTREDGDYSGRPLWWFLPEDQRPKT